MQQQNRFCLNHAVWNDLARIVQHPETTVLLFTVIRIRFCAILLDTDSLRGNIVHALVGYGTNRNPQLRSKLCSTYLDNCIHHGVLIDSFCT